MNWLWVIACLGVAFWVQHKVAPSVAPSEDSLLERLLSCSFCIGFWCGAGASLPTAWSLGFGDGLLSVVSGGFAIAVLYFYAETWASEREMRRLREEEHIGLIRRQKALADEELGITSSSAGGD